MVEMSCLNSLKTAHNDVVKIAPKANFAAEPTTLDATVGRVAVARIAKEGGKHAGFYRVT